MGEVACAQDLNAFFSGPDGHVLQVGIAAGIKEMLRLCQVRCPHMNQIQLQDTYHALKYTQYVVDVPEEIRVKALRSVQRMIEIG